MATVPKSVDIAATVETTLAGVPQRFVLHDIDWTTYQALGELLRDRHVRMTYDTGTLEFMTTPPQHERFVELMAHFFIALTEEMGVELANFGSMTCKGRRRRKALEPDKCYWIQHEPQVRGRDEIDLKIDPPPDLVLEVEVSRSLLDRLAILAALRVPEVWRFDGETIQILLLSDGGDYQESLQSRAFPFLAVSELLRFFAQRHSMGQNQLVRLFRQWVREQVAAGWPTAPKPTAPGKKKGPRRKT